MAKTLEFYESENKIIRKREDDIGREYWQEDNKDGSGYSRIDTEKKNPGKAVGGMGGADKTRQPQKEDDKAGGGIGVGGSQPDWFSTHSYKHQAPRVGIHIPGRGCETVSVTDDTATKVGRIMSIESDDEKDHTSTTFFFTVLAMNGDKKTVKNELDDILKCQNGGSGGVVISSGQ